MSHNHDPERMITQIEADIWLIAQGWHINRHAHSIPNTDMSTVVFRYAHKTWPGHVSAVDFETALGLTLLNQHMMTTDDGK